MKKAGNKKNSKPDKDEEITDKEIDEVEPLDDNKNEEDILPDEEIEEELENEKKINQAQTERD